MDTLPLHIKLNREGVVLLHDGKFQEAVEKFNEAINQCGNTVIDPFILVNRANAYIESEKYELAI